MRSQEQLAKEELIVKQTKAWFYELCCRCRQNVGETVLPSLHKLHKKREYKSVFTALDDANFLKPIPLTEADFEEDYFLEEAVRKALTTYDLTGVEAYFAALGQEADNIKEETLKQEVKKEVEQLQHAWEDYFLVATFDRGRSTFDTLYAPGRFKSRCDEGEGYEFNERPSDDIGFIELFYSLKVPSKADKNTWVEKLNLLWDAWKTYFLFSTSPLLNSIDEFDLLFIGLLIEVKNKNVDKLYLPLITPSFSKLSQEFFDLFNERIKTKAQRDQAWDEKRFEFLDRLSACIKEDAKEQHEKLKKIKKQLQEKLLNKIKKLYEPNSLAHEKIPCFTKEKYSSEQLDEMRRFCITFMVSSPICAVTPVGANDLFPNQKHSLDTILQSLYGEQFATECREYNLVDWVVRCINGDNEDEQTTREKVKIYTTEIKDIGDIVLQLIGQFNFKDILESGRFCQFLDFLISEQRVINKSKLIDELKKKFKDFFIIPLINKEEDALEKLEFAMKSIFYFDLKKYFDFSEEEIHQLLDQYFIERIKSDDNVDTSLDRSSKNAFFWNGRWHPDFTQLDESLLERFDTYFADSINRLQESELQEKIEEYRHFKRKLDGARLKANAKKKELQGSVTQKENRITELKQNLISLIYVRDGQTNAHKSEALVSQIENIKSEIDKEANVLQERNKEIEEAELKLHCLESREVLYCKLLKNTQSHFYNALSGLIEKIVEKTESEGGLERITDGHGVLMTLGGMECKTETVLLKLYQEKLLHVINCFLKGETGSIPLTQEQIEKCRQNLRPSQFEKIILDYVEGLTEINDYCALLKSDDLFCFLFSGDQKNIHSAKEGIKAIAFKKNVSSVQDICFELGEHIMREAPSDFVQDLRWKKAEELSQFIPRTKLKKLLKHSEQNLKNGFYGVALHAFAQALFYTQGSELPKMDNKKLNQEEVQEILDFYPSYSRARKTLNEFNSWVASQQDDCDSLDAHLKACFDTFTALYNTNTHPVLGKEKTLQQDILYATENFIKSVAERLRQFPDATTNVELVTAVIAFFKVSKPEETSHLLKELHVLFKAWLREAENSADLKSRIEKIRLYQNAIEGFPESEEKQTLLVLISSASADQLVKSYCHFDELMAANDYAKRYLARLVPNKDSIDSEECDAQFFSLEFVSLLNYLPLLQREALALEITHTLDKLPKKHVLLVSLLEKARRSLFDIPYDVSKQIDKYIDTTSSNWSPIDVQLVLTYGNEEQVKKLHERIKQQFVQETGENKAFYLYEYPHIIRRVEELGLNPYRGYECSPSLLDSPLYVEMQRQAWFSDPRFYFVKRFYTGEAAERLQDSAHEVVLKANQFFKYLLMIIRETAGGEERQKGHALARQFGTFLNAKTYGSELPHQTRVKEYLLLRFCEQATFNQQAAFWYLKTFFTDLQSESAIQHLLTWTDEEFLELAAKQVTLPINVSMLPVVLISHEGMKHPFLFTRCKALEPINLDYRELNVAMEVLKDASELSTVLASLKNELPLALNSNRDLAQLYNSLSIHMMMLRYFSERVLPKEISDIKEREAKENAALPARQRFVRTFSTSDEVVLRKKRIERLETLIERLHAIWKQAKGLAKECNVSEKLFPKSIDIAEVTSLERLREEMQSLLDKQDHPRVIVVGETPALVPKQQAESGESIAHRLGRGLWRLQPLMQLSVTPTPPSSSYSLKS